MGGVGGRDDLALLSGVVKRKEEEGRTWKADTTIDWIRMMKTVLFMRLGTLLRVRRGNL